ncbi:hypothetical protein SBA5_640026 [Candidatus Sulfotelmatomonas gaucii]|uniref:Uncharacterized protein n=1 Tax=Candidatus Sulfuritelmatomonas gaucii TaxID=2043161 RepID=A0A2N9LYD6_9BACT|nr:hypothetical protein SBA5_640026 [Candidatus Sulfotelmatomonas gaucii]
MHSNVPEIGYLGTQDLRRAFLVNSYQLFPVNYVAVEGRRAFRRTRRREKRVKTRVPNRNVEKTAAAC